MMQYNGSKWRGGTLQVQLAKSHYLEKLANEQAEAEALEEDLRNRAVRDQMQPFEAGTQSMKPLVIVAPSGTASPLSRLTHR